MSWSLGLCEQVIASPSHLSSFSPEEIVTAIKAEALRLGFSACGIARAEAVPSEVMASYDAWIDAGHQGRMEYLERNR